jgi:hypothetical protein
MRPPTISQNNHIHYINNLRLENFPADSILFIRVRGVSLVDCAYLPIQLKRLGFKILYKQVKKM